MRCKCKNEMIVYNIALTGNFHRSAFYYCHKCGRVCVRFSEKDEKWLESEKSKESNFIIRSDIFNILNTLKPKENISIKDKSKSELISDIEKEVSKIRKS